MYTFNINNCIQIRSTMILGVDSYMPRQLWNEGRVVGLSAYEVYLKQHLSKNPDIEPATEIEWLAASIASGSSMILKISAHETAGRNHRTPPRSFLSLSGRRNAGRGAASSCIASR